MLLRRPIVSLHDRERLGGAVERERRCWMSGVPHLDLFRANLRRARGVEPKEVPADLVTMNSRLVLRDHFTGQTIAYTLVYPGQEAPLLGRVSVLSPMGMALFGARVGDEVCWLSPVGPHVAVVERLLYQPEAAGHHHL